MDGHQSSPAGTTDSQARGVGGGQQAGIATTSNHTPHASLWSGSATWIDLNPVSSDYSKAYGADGGQQVGVANFGATERASLWSGIAASWIDLTPAGYGHSVANGVGQGQQVGFVEVGGREHASLWTGSAASWVDLNPSGALSSVAYGVSSGQQVGTEFVGGGVDRAGFWRGTAASWVDLSPAGATSSRAIAVGSGQQAGVATVGGHQHASLWSGSAGTWVDLNPPASNQSEVFGVDGGQQVGNIHAGGPQHASLWSGSAASWLDLHALLPSQYVSSQAYAIGHDGDHTYVVGWGSDTTHYEALMWIGPAPQTITATSTTLSPGIVVSGTPADLNTSNDVYYTLRPGVVLSSSQSPIVLNASYTLPASSAIALNSVVESRAQQANIRQTVEAYNSSTSSYTQLNQQILPTTTPDAVVTSPISPPANYIGAGNEVRLRISYKSVGPILSYPWQVFIDEATLRFVP